VICDYPVQTYYEYVQPYRDSFGLIAQAPANDRDGGDSSHRIGLFYGGLYLLFKDNKVVMQKVEKDLDADLAKITVGPGKFIRHPDHKMWYSNPDNFSRDQTISLIAVLGLFDSPEHRKLIRQNLQNVLDNHGFFPNRLQNWTNAEKHLPYDYNDIIGPDDFGLYIRAMRSEKWKWALWVTDSQTFLQSLINVVMSYVDNTSTSNDVNHTMRLLVSKHIWPTWWTRSAAYIYFNFRNYSPDTPESGHATSPVQSAWNYYFREAAYGPAIHKEFQCIIDKEFLGR
jgi:hypothetical protein